MEGGLDTRLQKRNESIKEAAGETGLPLDDLKNLQVSKSEEGAKKIETIEGRIRGIDLKITSENDGFRALRPKVWLDGNELRPEDGGVVSNDVFRFLGKESAANAEHVNEVYDEAEKENREFDRQRDPYRSNVSPLIERLYGKSEGQSN